MFSNILGEEIISYWRELELCGVLPRNEGNLVGGKFPRQLEGGLPLQQISPHVQGAWWRGRTQVKFLKFEYHSLPN